MINRSVILSLLIVLAVVPAAWADVQIKTIPPPPHSTKLRVFMYPFTLESSDLRRGAAWGTTHDDFSANQARTLEKTGIYEIVSESDVKAAIGDQDLGREQIKRHGWSLAREIGKALHADYAMVITRKKQKGMHGVDYIFEGVMINTETGKNFKNGFEFSGGTRTDVKGKGGIAERQKQVYRTIFNLAKEDMLAVAIKKMGSLASKSSVAPVKNVKKPEETAAPERTSTVPKKLFVYDLYADEQKRTVALILSEALREELLLLKQFELADPEDLQKARKQMTQQQIEMIDKKQAASMGREAGADQVVTGSLSLEGESFVAQAKRTDVETATPLGRATLTFKEGDEGDVMKRLPEFVRELMGSPQ